MNKNIIHFSLLGLFSKLYHGRKRYFYKVIHIFGCPDSSMTEHYKIRYCYKCGRFRYASRELKERLRKQLQEATNG